MIAVTRLTIMKKYDYGHLEEIEVRRDDQQLYTYKEGDFKRLRLEDMNKNGLSANVEMEYLDKKRARVMV
uniref:Uncharacterized protein n=1 Tax=Tanacetum cinerariifolium TaxID=118510 RepID=A0A699UIS2_TANCI|nr:hypothetical protein [Tanacetum cinerariifolium]